MKVNKEEIKRVEEYQRLKEKLKLLIEDLYNVTVKDLCLRRGWGFENLNFNYEKIVRLHIRREIKLVKRKLKEMEE